MAAVTALQVSVQSSLPEIKNYQITNSEPIKSQYIIRKKEIVKQNENIHNLFQVDTAESGEDDDDVISCTVTKRKSSISKTPSPYLSPNLNTRSNAIVKAFLRDRKQFSPSWTEAAESVFSDSHPFKQKRRNRSEEKTETQDKEKVPYRSSSESRCSFAKTQKKESAANIKKVEDVPKKKEVLEEECNNQQHHSQQQHQAQPQLQLQAQQSQVIQQQPRTSAGSKTKKREKESILEKKVQEVKTVNAVVKEIKSELTKSHDEHQKHHKSKRLSLSLSKQRHSSHINSERLGLLKAKVDAAIREHKVYSMTGHYNSVRRALRQRGWVEKIDSDFKGRRRLHKFDDSDDNILQVTSKSDTEKETESANAQAEAEIINRMLRNIPEDLCWLSKPYPYCWKDVNKCDMVNRLPKAYFSNKVGLCNSLAHMQWYYEPGICSTQYPRTYNISLRDEYDSFRDDFRLTACVSTLKWLIANFKNGGEAVVRSSDGKVDVNIIEFALRRCAEYVKFKEHEDIDMMELPIVWEHQWDHFLTQYYKLVNEGHILRDAKGDPTTQVLVSNAQSMVNLMRPYWPQMDIEGINNYWIVKPGGRCCGNGILIRSHLEEIMAIVNPSITRETRYVVQKYIEKPLLIYNTKFDIRQWFLVTNVYPLTIWMYKESYLRFCSTQFNLKNTHESIHLCNNAVQRRYKNGKRDRNLPDENMWDCYTFQTHLKALGYPTVWDEVIYPGMKESFIGALLASQDGMERRRNCFELYGADFMISEQITDGPWLIEINSNPAMDSSTSVTARMCPQVLEDIVKVVIDRRTDRNASTGAFELVFKQNCPPIPPYLGMSLSIRGKKVYKAPSEGKHIRRPRFRQYVSETDDTSDDTSDEGNIVQKRCSGDFMQPIKTLREEIDRCGGSSSREDHLSVPEELYSDSAANDTDTSRGSNSDRRMTLEGKEISLKKKKHRRKRHKNSNKSVNKFKLQKDDIKTESPPTKEDISQPSPQKRINRKTDWVRKNIDNIRGNYSIINNRLGSKFIINDKEDGKYISRSQENLNIYKDYILSGKCLDEYKMTNQASYDVLETLFREEMLKIISPGEGKHDKSPKAKRKISSREKSPTGIEKEDDVVKPKQGPVIIAGLWEPTAVKENEEDQNSVDEDLSIKSSSQKFSRLMVEGMATNRRSSSNEELDRSSCNSFISESDRNSISPDDATDGDSSRSSVRNNNLINGNLDFEAKFENELRHIEKKESKYLSGQKDFTKALSITAPDLFVKERGKATKWQSTKTSMEYFREWKYKIDETRRNCEDMLTKLRYFKENNSKLKFKDVLHRRIEEETRMIQKMKEYKTTNRWRRAISSEGLDSLTKCEKPDKGLENKKDLNLPKGDQRPKPKYADVKDFAPKIYASIRLKDNKLSYYTASATGTPLAISAESGAVRNVNEVLPKIRLRNRPLLPNASSGHCRNVDAAKVGAKTGKTKIKK